MLERKSNETDAQYNARAAYFKCAEANARAALGALVENDPEKAAGLGEMAEAQARIAYGDLSGLKELIIIY